MHAEADGRRTNHHSYMGPLNSHKDEWIGPDSCFGDFRTGTLTDLVSAGRWHWTMLRLRNKQACRKTKWPADPQKGEIKITVLFCIVKGLTHLTLLGLLEFFIPFQKTQYLLNQKGIMLLVPRDLEQSKNPNFFINTCIPTNFYQYKHFQIPSCLHFYFHRDFLCGIIS